jgi:hypothetical protein
VHGCCEAAVHSNIPHNTCSLLDHAASDICLVVCTEKYFVSKQRIESKWYYESPSFTIRNVDAVVTETGYAKAALFCVTSDASGTPQYSIDISSSDAPRAQLEVKHTSVLVQLHLALVE